MDWILENSVFILFFILMMAMHLFGHGMHGGHGRHGPHSEGEGHKGHPGSGDDTEQNGGHGCC